MGNPFLDSHTHFQMDEFEFSQRKDEYVKSLLDANVMIINDVGYDVDSSEKIKEIQFPSQIEHFSFCGIHPHYAEKATDEDIHKIKEMAASGFYSGIGEIGIDRWWHREDDVIQKQKRIFRQQLEIADEFCLPVMLHIRNAYEEAFEIISEYKNIRFDFHSFSGTEEHLAKITQRRDYFGVNGIVTFKKNSIAGILRREHLPFILIETDAPYLSPVPYRGKRNMPFYVVEIYNALSSILEIDMEDLKSIVKNNFYEFVNKNKS